MKEQNKSSKPKKERKYINNFPNPELTRWESISNHQNQKQIKRDIKNFLNPRLTIWESKTNHQNQKKERKKKT